MVQTWRLRKVVKMSSVCIQLVVIVVTLSLSDVVCQTVHNINISDEVQSGRQRRQAHPLTQEQISEMVDHHNVLRAREGASDMVVMIWNASLASLAATWAGGCHFEHPKGAGPEYNNVGQNLWAKSFDIDITEGIDAWYNEKADYTYDTMECVPGKKCGHYTQVVWANTRHVGCAVHRCVTMTSTRIITPALYLVCNYSPIGNRRGSKPYTKGPACSKCGSGAGWCKNKLCDSECQGAGEGCSCAAICYNCATFDLETCRCSCAKGWHGPDCKARCEDTHENCNGNPGWPSFMCDKDFVKAGCPAMCGLCEVDAHAEEGQCPPVYGPDADTDAWHPEAAHALDSDTDSAQTKFITCHQATIVGPRVV